MYCPKCRYTHRINSLMHYSLHLFHWHIVTSSPFVTLVRPDACGSALGDQDHQVCVTQNGCVPINALSRICDRFTETGLHFQHAADMSTLQPANLQMKAKLKAASSSSDCSAAAKHLQRREREREGERGEREVLIRHSNETLALNDGERGKGALCICPHLAKWCTAGVPGGLGDPLKPLLGHSGHGCFVHMGTGCLGTL